jgi:hypothetical protein
MRTLPRNLPAGLSIGIRQIAPRITIPNKVPAAVGIMFPRLGSNIQIQPIGNNIQIQPISILAFFIPYEKSPKLLARFGDLDDGFFKKRRTKRATAKAGER